MHSVAINLMFQSDKRIKMLKLAGIMHVIQNKSFDRLTTQMHTYVASH